MSEAIAPPTEPQPLPHDFLNLFPILFRERKFGLRLSIIVVVAARWKIFETVFDRICNPNSRSISSRQ